MCGWEMEEGRQGGPPASRCPASSRSAPPAEHVSLAFSILAGLAAPARVVLLLLRVPPAGDNLRCPCCFGDMDEREGAEVSLIKHLNFGRYSILLLYVLNDDYKIVRSNQTGRQARLPFSSTSTST
jgi:hypothetical protein